MESEFEPPWPEWQDQFINETKWNAPGSLGDEAFIDHVNHGALPHYLRVAKWKRPAELYEDASAPWKIGDEHERFDLISSNRHLIDSKIMRRIMSSIMCLEKIGRQNPGDRKTYHPNSPGTSDWKPWHHIYAVSKIGKGRPSSPMYNPQGMYYIRLFYMGKWRRLTVDDYLPYNDEKSLLLPISHTKFDLWLPILSKALLRIASLTWTKEDDMVDFNVVTCLTGWIEYKLDCRYISIDKIWKVIKLNLFNKPKRTEKNDEFCLTCDTTNCLSNKHDHGCESYSSRIIFGLLDKTRHNEIKDISPAPEHVIYFCFAQKQPINENDEMPTWKNLRWVNWAIENKVINTKPGSCLRIVGIFSPFSGVIALRRSKEPEPVAALGGHLFPKSITGYGNIFDLMLEAQTQVTVSQDNIPMIDDTLEFNFAEIYPYLRELTIYYRSQDFYESLSIDNIETFVDAVSEKPDLILGSQVKLSRKTKANKPIIETAGNKHKVVEFEREIVSSSDSSCDYETCRYFYLFSDTPYCKNIYFTLSIVQECGMKFGYLVCEKYNWKSVAFGPLLLGVRTVGTKTCLLQLGPGVQVCRVFFSLPSKYQLVMNSGTYFTLLNVDKLHEVLSQYTKPLVIQGDKMLKGFKQLLPVTPKTPEHIQLICNYKKTLYPPGYKEFTLSLQIKLAQDYEEVFDEAFTKYIFDSCIPMRTKVALLNDLKVIFNNQEFGEPYIHNLDKRMIKDIKSFKKDLAMGIVPNRMISKLKMLNEFYRENNMELLELPEDIEAKEDSVVDQFDLDMLLNAETHIEVLRKILDKKPQYLQFYPFMNEHYLLLKYKNYEGITEITPAHNWFVIARLTLNIHSTKAVPCGIYVITEFPKAVLYVIDTDSCEKLSLPPGLSATFHLKRNKIGYTILLCGYATPDMIAEELSMAWKIRLLGIDNGNTLHPCDSINPYYCQERESFESNLFVQNVTGYYLPNTDNIIGRFIISISKSMLATLYLSVSNEEVNISLTLKGLNEETIFKAEGKGSVFIPVILLDLNYGVPSRDNEEIHLFFGTIHLMSPWILSSAELAFAKVIRSSSKKDIISLGALYNEIAAETNDDGVHEVVEEKFEPEKVSIAKSPVFQIESQSKESHTIPKLVPTSSSDSYCGYDSSQTESKDSICKSESTSSSREQSSINSSIDTSVSQESDDVSTRKTGGISSESTEVLESSLNSSSERSRIKKNYLKIVEDPFGLCGAGPYWVLSYVIDSHFESYSFVDNDYISYEEFHNLKDKWLTENPKRLEKGEELRKDFLNAYKNDFLKFQLDPENISVSDFSEEEKIPSDDESNQFSSYDSEHFNAKSDINAKQTYPVSLFSSDSSGSLHHDGSELHPDLKRNSACKIKFDGLQEFVEKNITSKNIVETDAKLSQNKLFVKKSSYTGVDGEYVKKTQDLSLIHKVFAKTKKRLENILFHDESSCSSNVSGDSKNVKDFSKRCPPVPVITNALMKHYSLPFDGRPTLMKLIPNRNETPSLSKEELRKICSKKKVSFPTVYRKLVAPVLWSVTNNKMPYCLKDLPVQAYAQKRFSDKLERTLKIIQNERRKEMLIRESFGAKRFPSGKSSFQKQSTASKNKETLREEF